MIKQLSEADFRVVVSRQLTVYRLLHIGLLSGVVALAGFEYVISRADLPPSIPMPRPVELMQGMSYIHAFVATAMYLLAGFMPNLGLPGSFLNPPPDLPALTPETLFARLRLIRLVQLIAMEMVAIVGLLVCIVGTKAGVMHTHPIFWLNLASSIVFVGFVYRGFPTEEKLIRHFNQLRAS